MDSKKFSDIYDFCISYLSDGTGSGSLGDVDLKVSQFNGLDVDSSSLAVSIINQNSENSISVSTKLK